MTATYAGPIQQARLRCEWYARGYNDTRPLSTPVPEAHPYVDPVRFADWYLAGLQDVTTPSVGVADAFSIFKAQVTAGLTASPDALIARHGGTLHIDE